MNCGCPVNPLTRDIVVSLYAVPWFVVSSRSNLAVVWSQYIQYIMSPSFVKLAA